MNSITRYMIDSVIKRYVNELNWLTSSGGVAQFASIIGSFSPAVLSNGIGTTANIVSGGTGMTAPTGVIVPPPGFPGNAVVPTVTLSITGGAITGCVVTNQGSGMGIATADPRGVPVVITDATGTIYPTAGGAQIFIPLANTAQLYNYSPSEVATLQDTLCAGDYVAIGQVLLGLMQSAVVPAGFSLHAAGNNYTPNDVLTVIYQGLEGCTIKVLTVSGGGGTGPISTWAVLTPGFGSFNTPVVGLTMSGGTGSGAQFNISSYNPAVLAGPSYNFLANSQALAGWGF